MSFLFENIENYKRFSGESREVPEYILRGLAPGIKLRDYQMKALESFLMYVESDFSKNKQIWNLFHMATGSGKTVIMAALILYYYNKGYRNFLFFVRNINIIDKTIENLTNPTYSKYLFANPLEIEGNKVRINKVDNFQYTDKDAINICFTSNAGLQNSLSLIPSENSLSISDFEDNKVVMFADESHHLNAETKHGQYYFEDEEDRSWESTTMKAFRANKDNVLLEFTATVDLKNPYVKEKYKDVIVYDYPLSRFREEKYSKDIISLPSTDDWMKRVFIALIISQYRYKLFQKIGYNIKPVIMIKSKSIKERDEFYENYLNFLKNSFNESYLNEIKDENKGNPMFIEMFDFFEKHDIHLSSLVEEIKIDFAQEHSISIDSNRQKITAEESKLLNSLEDIDNPYRLIFVVDMLNEGWDVLNLFDIVRLYDTRDGNWHRNGTYVPGRTTISEMQLIGRGARYYPFKIEPWHEENKRKFDNQIDNPYRLCETLVYHCTTDNRYITEIRATLRESGLVPDIEPTKIELKVKETFKAERFYKLGYVFTNERVEKGRDEINELPHRFRSIPIEYNITPKTSGILSLFDSTETLKNSKENKIIKIKSIPKNILFKGIRQYPALSFNKLITKFPNLNTMDEFLLDKNYLGDMIIELSYPQDYNYSNDDLLNAYLKLLEEVAKYISRIEIQYEGTQKFSEKPIKDFVKDITTYREIAPGAQQGLGVAQKVDLRYALDLSDKDWYVYNENYGTSEEKSFVKYFSKIVDDFKTKYEKVFLVRNENQLGIYSFNTGERFEPDYLLFLGDKDLGKKSVFYQIFIEPKGSQYLGHDGTFTTGKEGWKEQLLKEITDKKIEHTIFYDSSVYKIWGLPFYNELNTLEEFDKEFKKFL